MPLLLLDLDDTLVVRAPLLRAWGERFLGEQGLPADRLDDLIAADDGGHVGRREFHHRLRAELGYAASYTDFVGPHEDAVSGGYRMTDDTRAALDEARAAGWSLGVVTNGYLRRQTRKLVASGLLDLVDAVCISEEVGVAKPDPAIFRLAASRAGSTLDGACMVGDNLDADIAGARAVGIRSVWVRNPHEWLTFTSGAVPDHEAPDAAAAIRLVLAST